MVAEKSVVSETPQKIELTPALGALMPILDFAGITQKLWLQQVLDLLTTWLSMPPEDKKLGLLD